MSTSRHTRSTTLTALGLTAIIACTGVVAAGCGKDKSTHHTSTMMAKKSSGATMTKKKSSDTAMMKTKPTTTSTSDAMGGK